MPETKILISWGIFLFLCICGIFLARSIQRSGFLWFLQFLILGPVAAIRLISNTIDMRWYRIVSEDICDYADPDCPIEIKKVAVLDEGRTGRFCRIETNNFTTTDVRNIICKIYLLEDGQKTSDINEYNQFIKSPVKLKKNKTVYEFPFTDDKRFVKAVVRILFIEFENGLRWECKPEHFFHYILNPITDHELRKNAKELLGDDAQMSFYELASFWCCTCGRLNSQADLCCRRCGRNKAMLTGIFPAIHAPRNLERLSTYHKEDVAVVNDLANKLNSEQLSRVRRARGKRGHVWTVAFYGIAVTFFWAISWLLGGIWLLTKLNENGIINI